MKGKRNVTERKRLPNECKWNIEDSLDDLETARGTLTDVAHDPIGEKNIRALSDVKDVLWRIQMRLMAIKPKGETE